MDILRFFLLKIIVIIIYPYAITESNIIGLQQISNFNNEALFAHNKYRAEHGYESVKLSLDLMKLANEEAQRLAQLDRPDVKNIEYNSQIIGVNYAFFKGTNYYSGNLIFNKKKFLLQIQYQTLKTSVGHM